MKTLGLIGGTSWHSTIEYYREINTQVSKEIGSASNPELLLYSINIDIMRKQVLNDIQQKYLEVSQKLIKAGAEAILICANTPHMAADFVQPKINVPILHIADATAEEAKKMGYKKLGLLGNKPTMTKAFLKDRIAEKHDLQVCIPDEKEVQQSHYFVSKELTQGKFTQEAKDFYVKQIIAFKNRGVDAVILGCTELPILLKDVQTELPVLSTTDLHIQMATNFIMNT
ncbi:aspartate/glutamate racemase family protein [Psychroflexus planctonicus]|uniref:Racemase n=1 Tax=Psychroflexus planctonicus TaxID=1526575 RepID=A0ABQ1SDK4_9FLAO|nr:amino acid racemase [Psychroflexus planctonicus]GGE31002.1 racemase [Psychroflexus planctonicus]